jgi:hypothetical protein
MIILSIVCFIANPFYECNFTPLPMRSTSVFSNPAGLGVQTGAETYATFQQVNEAITAGACAGNLGFGYRKVDTLDFFEIGVGYKLPGAFSLGYAYDFGDTSVHMLGVQCRASDKLSLGYKMTFGTTKFLYGGISIMPYLEYITLNFEMEYEGIEDTLAYYFGAMLQPYAGATIFFMSDKEFNWHAGIGLSLGYLKLSGAYSYEESKFSAGVLISAQEYRSIIP